VNLLGFLDDFDWDEQHHSFQDLERGKDTGSSVGSDFFDEIMNDRTSLEGLTSMSDNQEETHEHVELAKDSARKPRKRTIDDIQEGSDLPLKDGILIFI
jgi:hypothetical protein